jgi:hypothetical protein
MKGTKDTVGGKIRWVDSVKDRFLYGFGGFDATVLNGVVESCLPV